jgi:hypothetical protein
MDYRAAARFRATKLTDLIAEEMLASGDGLLKSSRKAISAKTKAKLKGVQQTFDPLNIASALVGRSRLGTTLIGKMFGRSAEDITYFAGDRGTKAKPIRKFRYKNPLITSISSGDVSPTRRNDSLANIFGKIYNILKKEKEEDVRQKEIEEDFKKEKEDEDERRHKELIKAIKIMKQGTKVSDKRDDEDGSIFGKFLKIAKGVFNFVGKILGTIYDIIVGLGKIIFNVIGKIASIAFDMIKFVAEGIGKIVFEVFGLVWNGIKKIFGTALERIFIGLMEKLAGCGCGALSEDSMLALMRRGKVLLPAISFYESLKEIKKQTDERPKKVEKVQKKITDAASKGDLDSLKSSLEEMDMLNSPNIGGPGRKLGDFMLRSTYEDTLNNMALEELRKVPQTEKVKDAMLKIMDTTPKMISESREKISPFQYQDVYKYEGGKTTYFEPSSMPAASLQRNFERIETGTREKENLQMEAKRKRSRGNASNQTNNIVVPSENKSIFSSGPAAVHDVDLNNSLPLMNYGRPRF